MQVYEAREGEEGSAEDRLVAVFLHDNFGRPNKRCGAWMSELRASCPAIGSVPIIILNNNNFAKGSEGRPTLLSWGRRPRPSSTSLATGGATECSPPPPTCASQAPTSSGTLPSCRRPSQLMEHWLEHPEVLKSKHARHYETQEVVPDGLLARLKAAQGFNQGSGTVVYTISALLDQDLHQLPR